ncbi:MAG: amino acid ABC transporter substrate-binding protein, partial [Chloroflexi bacterium]|nr:amino acid ABC transporter substrate-binding protein [Chloroflexota bacterium]
ESGQFYGFDVDLAQALAARWGVRAEFVNMSFDGLYDALLVKRCDLILSALPYDRTMTRDVLYTQPYFNVGQVLLVRPEEQTVSSLADLAGRRVGVELGTEGHHLLRSWNRSHPQPVEIVPFRERENLLQALAQSQVSAIVCDQVMAFGLVQGGVARRAGPMLTAAPLVGATRPEGARLVAEFQHALEAWQADGTWLILQERWFGQGEVLP